MKGRDLFSASRVAARHGYHTGAPEVEPDKRDRRKLKAVLNRVASTGRVNGMTKAELRRRYPKRLAPVTVPKR